MKRIIAFLTFMALVCFSPVTVFAQPIQVDCASGSVGIGGSPNASYDLYVNNNLLVGNNAVVSNNLNFTGGTNSITGLDIIYGNYGSMSLPVSTNAVSISGSIYRTNALYVDAGGADYSIYSNGDIYCNGTVTETSDKRIKKEISDLDALLVIEKLSRLNGKSYKLKSKEELLALYRAGILTFNTDTFDLYQLSEALFYQAVKKDRSLLGSIEQLGKKEREKAIRELYLEKAKQQYDFAGFIGDSLGLVIRVPHRDDAQCHLGLIAQDVMEEFPELVRQDSSTRMYGINYTGFIPLLLESVKELYRQNQTLQTIVSAHEGELLALKAEKGDLKSTGLKGGQESTGEKSILYQNTPNPFNQSTEIKYYLTAGDAGAFISVCNLNGTQLKSIPIHRNGEGSITIDRETLQPGIYLYALVANGELVDTKKMMITE